ncbi:MAG: hypothetical protein PHH54_03130 [Candidatus Nanoarchaeia archaeon]|nr:hypothetical protein [Candidatus Nanoarchaeia archaeon]MDD5740954.1 hypothetical protein [Candidatus Nanoarchaeia archaeon]
MEKRNKKGAMEMSIGTIVIIVIAMSMLILGLVLVRTIFKGATESITEIDSKVKGEIKNLFVDENTKIIVKLGSDKDFRIRADATLSGVGFGAKTIDGSIVDIKEMKYKLSLDANSRENCITLLKERTVVQFFKQNLNTNLQFDQVDGDTAFAAIQISVPEGTPLCTQKVFIDVWDGETYIGRDFFIVDVIRKGFF